MVYAGKNISNNSVCVFPANHKSRLTDLSNQMRAKIAQYLYMITNNYAEDKHGTQWWSFLDKQKKEYALLIQLLWHYWTTRFPCWKRQKNIQKGHNKYATDIQKGQWSHPSEMERQKAQLSVSDSERTPTAIGYGILLLQILWRVLEVQRNWKHGAGVHREQLLAEFQHLLLWTFFTLFLSESIWTTGKERDGSGQIKKLYSKLLSKLVEGIVWPKL